MEFSPAWRLPDGNGKPGEALRKGTVPDLQWTAGTAAECGCWDDCPKSSFAVHSHKKAAPNGAAVYGILSNKKILEQCRNSIGITIGIVEGKTIDARGFVEG
jgi:hypothetical protein